VPANSLGTLAHQSPRSRIRGCIPSHPLQLELCSRRLNCCLGTVLSDRGAGLFRISRRGNKPGSEGRILLGAGFTCDQIKMLHNKPGTLTEELDIVEREKETLGVYLNIPLQFR
jgi:hypothetical protein